jgi:hypothetical protein
MFSLAPDGDAKMFPPLFTGGGLKDRIEYHPKTP